MFSLFKKDPYRKLEKNRKVLLKTDGRVVPQGVCLVKLLRWEDGVEKLQIMGERSSESTVTSTIVSHEIFGDHGVVVRTRNHSYMMELLQ